MHLQQKRKMHDLQESLKMKNHVTFADFSHISDKMCEKAALKMEQCV